MIYSKLIISNHLTFRNKGIQYSHFISLQENLDLLSSIPDSNSVEGKPVATDIFDSFIRKPNVSDSDPLASASPEELHVMALNSDNILISRICRNHKALPKTLVYLTKDPVNGPHNWIHLIKNPNLPEKQVRWIHRQVNTSFWMKLLLEFASDVFLLRPSNDEEILKFMAIHPNTPEPIIQKLSKHRNPAVRFAVIDNSDLRLNTKIAILNDIIANIGYQDNTLFLNALSHKDLHRNIRNVVIEQTLKGKLSQPLSESDRSFFEGISKFQELSSESKSLLEWLLR